MNDFVNFRKRAVALPSGCKDLVDVLKRRSREKAASSRALEYERFGSDQGGLGDIERYIRAELEEPPRLNHLLITRGLEGVANVQVATHSRGTATLGHGGGGQLC